MMQFTVANLTPLSGVYEIKCIATGRSYIGQSVDVISRFRVHIADLRNNRHRRRRMQEDWNKHGESSFLFCLIEECEPDCIKLQSRERFCIFDRYSSGAELYLSPIGLKTLKKIEDDKGKLQQWLNVSLSPETVR